MRTYPDRKRERERERERLNKLKKRKPGNDYYEIAIRTLKAKSEMQI